MEFNVNEENFEKEVLKCELPVLVDVWATWCGPCRMLAPVVEKMASVYDNRIKVCKVNADENPGLCKALRIDAIPAIFIFKDEKIKYRGIGYMSENEMQKIIEDQIQ